MSPEEVESTLEAARFTTSKDSPYPYYVIQLAKDQELELNGQLVSDALVAHMEANPDITHVHLQTHGWNTPPDKAVAVPFSEFMAGMQDDPNMPTPESGFKPLFIAFIWQALPLKFFWEKDAKTREELVKQSEEEQETGDVVLAEAIDASIADEENGGETSDAQKEKLTALVRELKVEGDIDDDDDDDDAVVQRAITAAAEPEAPEGVEGLEIRSRGFLTTLFRKAFRPVEHLMFGRLMGRGRKTGRVMQEIIAKLMNASGENPVKYCLMGNSLAAHVLAGALEDPCVLPRKVHTVFFVQGAAACKDFHEGGKYETVRNNVAGPIVCTLSEHDKMLLNVFGTFHGDALGIKGVPESNAVQMKSCEELEEGPYEWACAKWNSVDGSRFIDEGNAVAGGHGDFKEDETTMAYWAAINADVPPEAYVYA